jgi:hypothetical protein
VEKVTTRFPQLPSNISRMKSIKIKKKEILLEKRKIFLKEMTVLSFVFALFYILLE